MKTDNSLFVKPGEGFKELAAPAPKNKWYSKLTSTPSRKIGVWVGAIILAFAVHHYRPIVWHWVNVKAAERVARIAAHRQPQAEDHSDHLPYTKPVFVREKPDHPWVDVEIPSGWALIDEWGKAPVNTRIYTSTPGNSSPEPIVQILPPSHGQDYGVNVWKKGYQLAPVYQGRATTGYVEITCKFVWTGNG